jgi:hypothetical protein
VSLFYTRYGCHQGALVLHKRTGVVYRVRGNIGLWDMTAVLVPNEVCAQDEVIDGKFCEGVKTATSDKMKRDYLILEEGRDPLEGIVFKV